jgi:5'-nucleotidase
LLGDSNQIGANNKPVLVDKEEVLRSSTRKYLIVAGEYMVQGGDGYDALKGKKLVITTENGQSKSALIRKYLLGEFFELFSWWNALTIVVSGAQFLNKTLEEKPENRNLKSKAVDILGGVENQIQQVQQLPYVSKVMPMLHRSLPKFGSSGFQLPTSGSFHLPTSGGFQLPTSSGFQLPNVGDYVPPEAREGVATAIKGVKWLTSQRLFSAALAMADFEDMGFLDAYERQRARITAGLLRAGPLSVDVHLRMNLGVFSKSQDTKAAADKEDAKVNAAEQDAKKTLPIIHPIVDGRLKDVAKG